MTVKDKQGRILTSENPVICGMWKKAGYKEVTKKKSAKVKAHPPENGE